MYDLDPQVGELLEARTPAPAVDPAWEDVLRRARPCRARAAPAAHAGDPLAPAGGRPRHSVGIAAATARHRLVDYLSGGPTRQERHEIAPYVRRLAFRAGIRADLRRTRRLVAVTLGGHRYVYFMAPLTRGSGGCTFEIVDRRTVADAECGLDPRGRHPAVSPPRVVGAGTALGAESYQVGHGPVWVVLGVMPAARGARLRSCPLPGRNRGRGGDERRLFHVRRLGRAHPRRTSADRARRPQGGWSGGRAAASPPGRVRPRGDAAGGGRPRAADLGGIPWSTASRTVCRRARSRAWCGSRRRARRWRACSAVPRAATHRVRWWSWREGRSPSPRRGPAAGRRRRCARCRWDAGPTSPSGSTSRRTAAVPSSRRKRSRGCGRRRSARPSRISTRLGRVIPFAPPRPRHHP